jgi:hypothetical protein
MTVFTRDFGIEQPPQREVSFTLAGEPFECKPDIYISVIERYNAALTPGPDPNTVQIPLSATIGYIEDSLRNGDEIERFRKLRTTVYITSEQLQGIREFLLETYSGVGPTNALAPSSVGPPVSGPTSMADSGSPAVIPS